MLHRSGKTQSFARSAVLLIACAVSAMAASGCMGPRQSSYAAAPEQTAKRDASQLDPAQLAAAMTSRMNDTLGLTSSQHDRVSDINERYASELKGIATSNQSRRAKASSLKDMQARKDAEMSQVLTESQYQSYQAMKQQMQEQMRARMQQ